MPASPLSVPTLPGPWRAVITSRSSTKLLIDISGESDTEVSVELERCTVGRLRHAYPVNAQDIEIRVRRSHGAVGTLLGVLVPAVWAVDPRCRRIVFAAPVADSDSISAAQAAGFRKVLDVELPEAELSLFVAEPDWVTGADMDLDRVPEA